VNALLDLYRENRCVYGVRKLWQAARREGLDVGRDQVGQLMPIAGIQGLCRGAHRTVTTTAQPSAERHPDLVKRAWSAPNRPDATSVADFTHVCGRACGFVYVSFVTDVFSRRILGWKVATSKTVDLVTVRCSRRCRPGGGGTQSSPARGSCTIPMPVRSILLWRSLRNSSKPRSLGRSAR
jgi:putative transposase